MSKKVDYRDEQILKALHRSGEISSRELSEELSIPLINIRYSLTRLSGKGLVRKTHGGAKVIEPLLYRPFRHEGVFQSREVKCAEQKQRIGYAAAALVREGETICMNAGTTTTQIGRALRNRRNIHVVTNAVNIAMELSNQAAITTTVVGGTLPWHHTFAIAGSVAIDFMGGMQFDKLFLGVGGLDSRHGVTMTEYEEASVARAMIKQSAQVIAVADSSKVGAVLASRVCEISEVHRLVTDTGLSHSHFSVLTASGVDVLMV